MTQMIETKRLTGDDLLNLPSDGQRYELIEGQLIVMAPTTDDHGYVELNIGTEIRNFLKSHKLGKAGVGEIGFYTRGNQHTTRAADVIFTSNERLAQERSSGAFSDIPPDIVVEVISPSERTGEIEAKTKEWLAFGVREVWNAYPGPQSIHIHRRDGKPLVLFADDVLDGGNILPGFQVRVGTFFED